jgi:VanZ family protein
MKNFLIRNPKIWKTFLICCLITIFVISSLSLKSVQVPFNAKDKIIHAFEYFGLGLCFMGYFVITCKKSILKSGLLTLLWGSLYGVTDEIHQGFVGYFDTGVFSGVRSCDWRDWVADCIGLSVSVIIFGGVIKIWHYIKFGKFETTTEANK